MLERRGLRRTRSSKINIFAFLAVFYSPYLEITLFQSLELRDCFFEAVWFPSLYRSGSEDLRVRAVVARARVAPGDRVALVEPKFDLTLGPYADEGAELRVL